MSTRALALSTLLFLGAASCALADGPRRLLLDASPSPSPASPSPAPAGPFVAGAAPVPLSTELLPMMEALQNHAEIQAVALACAEATGLRSIASDLPLVFLNTLKSFKSDKFCRGLPSLAEELDRLSYMVSYGVSLHLRGVLQSDYLCEGMTVRVRQRAGVGARPPPPGYSFVCVRNPHKPRWPS